MQQAVARQQEAPGRRRPVLGPPPRMVLSHPARQSPRRSSHGYRAALAVLVVGAVVVGVLTWAVAAASGHTEARLLQTQVRQAAAVLQLDAGVIQHPLAAASELAATDPKAFAGYAASEANPHKGFRTISLWRRAGDRYVPTTSVGTGYVPTAATPGVQAMLAAARRTRQLGVVGLLRRPSELVYGFVAVAGGGKVAVVGTQPLPHDRLVRPASGSAFSELNYALYLGRRPVADRLVFATTRQVPLRGDTASAVIPFGTTSLYLVATAVGWLGGTLSQWLPVALAVIGALITLAAAFLVERVVRRREEAERLAGEVGRLYGEQRGIAETLQQALLPDAPAPPPGLEVAVRYATADSGVDVGGDWYDVVPLGDGRLLAVVGDVSGRGVEAARVMAALRFGLRAYAAEGEPLPSLMEKVAGLLDVNRDGHFATLLALMVDVDDRRCAVVNAGHLPPLLVDGDQATYLETDVAPPIGVPGHAYRETVHLLPPGATVLAFTDGLVERRAEGVDPGLEELRALGATHRGNLESLVGTALRTLAPAGGDDTAILALRWRS